MQAIDDGASTAAACKAAGVEPSDLDAWLERGEEASAGKYAGLFADVTTAQAKSVGRCSAKLSRIAVPLNYEPHDYQRKLHALQLDLSRRTSYRRFIAACCGRRGGKTYGGAAHFAARVMLDLEQKIAGEGRWEGAPHHTWDQGEGRVPTPFLHYWVVAPTYALLDEPKKALQHVLGLVENGGVIVHQTDRRWWLLGGIQIEFKSGDNPKRLVGAGLDGVWIDEAARLKPAVWRDNLRPTLSDKRGWALFTTTPLGKNWFWAEVWARGDAGAAEEVAGLDDRRVEDILDDQFGCIAWVTADNTAVPGLAEEMETARTQMSRALFDRNYRASFEAFEGQCFEILTRSRHLRTGRGKTIPIARMVKAWGGLDIGVSDHPSVFVLMCQDREGVYHELRHELRRKILPHHADAWRQREQGNRDYMSCVIWGAITETLGEGWWRKIPIYCPADNGDWSEYLRQAGFLVERAYQSHEPAVTWVDVALHNNLLTIQDGNLWRCLENLHYPQPGETTTKLWVDKNDDSWDAMRYALSASIIDVRHGKLPLRAPRASVMMR